MALALYRKYRPATLAEVAGQEHVTAPLRTALGAGRVNHAYLFSGPRGCGKTSCARILARSLNCAHGPTPDPCGECDSCRALAPEGGGSVDVVELDAASHGGVDDARELRDRAFFAPGESRYRVFVIDEAHMVTTQGFNALLKIVEEPPEHLIFVFATTEPDKVISTIRSRTHHYPFRLVPPGTMRDLVERICADEGVHIDPGVYPLAIRAGGGSVRDTLSVLDQLLAGASEHGVTYERAVALLGVTDVALIDDTVDALAAGDAATVYSAVDRVVEAGHDPRRFAGDLLDRLRNLVLLKSVPDAADRGLVDAGGDELTRMTAQADRLGPATLSRYAEIVHNGLSEMRGATAPRLLLELLCARMMLPAAEESEVALLQRLEQVERRLTIAPSTPAISASGSDASAEGHSEPAAASQPPPDSTHAQAGEHGRPSQSATPERAEHAQATDEAHSARADPQARAPEPQPAPEARSAAAPASEQVPSGAPAPSGEPASAGSGDRAAELDAAAVRRVWSELLRAVAERNRPTQALLLNATVQDLRDGTLLLSMPTEGLAKQFGQERRLEVMRGALSAVFGGEWTVRCVPADAVPRALGQGRDKQPPAAEPGPPEPSHPDARAAPGSEAGTSSGAPAEESPRDVSQNAPRSQHDSSGQDTQGSDSAPHEESAQRSEPQPDRSPQPRRTATPDEDVPPPEEPPDHEPPPPEDVGSPGPWATVSGRTETGREAAESDAEDDAGAAESEPAGPADSGTGGSGPADSATPGPAEAPGSARDPDAEAVRLLQEELGARKLG